MNQKNKVQNNESITKNEFIDNSINNISLLFKKELNNMKNEEIKEKLDNIFKIVKKSKLKNKDKKLIYNIFALAILKLRGDGIK